MLHSMRQSMIVSTWLLATATFANLVSGQQCNGPEQQYCDANNNNNINNLENNHLTPSHHACLRVAVVEHSRIDVPEDCRASATANLDVLEKLARIAHENGAKMLVFPEDGIIMNSVRVMKPCLEMIPDPETLNESNNNPCISASSEESPYYRDNPILTRLSCLARKYELYLVANYGTREPCDNSNDDQGANDIHQCPDKTRDFMMLNTDVVLDPSGRYIKRYRKWHPFSESEIFDKAPRLEHTYFDTPFGRFGVFTCFDMIYRDPAVDLVEQFNIDTAVFPTWWYDEVPILTAVQYQDGWSSTHQVNMLAANVLRPIFGSTGSSIFSGNNSVYVSQSGSEQVRRTKLLIANIESKPRAESQVCQDKFDPLVIEIDDNETRDAYKNRPFKLLEGDAIGSVTEIQGTTTLCAGEFCCTLEYELPADTELEQLKRLILIVRDGRRPGMFKWYEQVCALSVLEKPVHDTAELLRKVNYDSRNGVHFLRLSWRATFDSRYVYPSAAHDSSHLIERRRRPMRCKATASASGGSPTVDEHKSRHQCQMDFVADAPSGDKLYSFAMYGRLYERDPVGVVGG